ncbi:formate--tetrahydrofolate ligase [bacterium]|nr:formate--tetrahydrofolate ligase [bacterium]
MTDIEIAQSVTLRHIREISSQLNISEDDMELYGKYKAKLPLNLINEEKVAQNKLVLVTAISPTPAGEGKTTISIGLTQGLNKIGKKTTVVLREPSLGPVFGIKGGAAGGGWSQVLPMEDINLHFTGDFSAVEKAHNLLAALIDNNIQSKSRSLGLDPRTIAWKRVMDMNDRSLRKTIIGLGGAGQGIPRETGFDITAASEIMAILCLSKDLHDLKQRLGNIFIGFTNDKKAIYARDLNAHGAMTALLKDAIKPNLVQTIEGTPAIIHGGPFANIAQGTNTVVATKMGLSLSPYVVTEAGFGADLGAEKFLDIKCVSAGLKPSAVVIVATIKALKYHGTGDLTHLKDENVEGVKRGLENLEKHIENVKGFGLQPVVAINKFITDTDAEIAAVQAKCEEHGVKVAVAEVWAKGGEGAKELATLVAEVADNAKAGFTPTYDWKSPVTEKIEAIATKIYGADGVDYTAQAQKDLKRISSLGLDALPICMAKTQKSLSDNPDLLGRPRGFNITVREIEVAAGAGFLVPITGDMMRMPGLPATPSAEFIDIDENGNIQGLF